MQTVRERIRRCAITVAGVLSRMVYRVACIQRRRAEVLFASRCSARPSEDFLILGHEFELQGFTPVYVTMHASKLKAFLYIGHVIREIHHLARCQICVLDRYDPIIALLNFPCEPDGDMCDQGTIRFTSFPVQPMILQIWHASGAYKRFGYQDLSSREGHTREFLHDYQIHRNYSWIICSGVGCQSVYAEAFGYPVDRVLPTGRPIEERLRNSSSKNNRRDRLSAGASRVVIAPTIRHSEESPHPLRNAYETFRSRPHDALWDGIDVCWAFHPLEAHCDVEQAGSGMLRNVDAVVTDYSSIVYDAYLLHVPVIFYVSDIVSYREAPGLNRDPLTVAPRLCCKTPVELKQLLTAVLADPSTYPWDQLERFVGDVFDGSSTHPAQTIASRAIAYIRED